MDKLGAWDQQVSGRKSEDRSQGDLARNFGPADSVKYNGGNSLKLLFVKAWLRMCNAGTLGRRRRQEGSGEEKKNSKKKYKKAESTW